MFKLIPDDINFDFIGKRKIAMFISGVVVLSSVVVVALFGLNLGIDFKGGSSVIVAFQGDAAVDQTQLEKDIATMVDEELGAQGTQVTVQEFDSGVQSTGSQGQTTERFLIYTEVSSLLSSDKRDQIVGKLKEQFGDKTRIDVPGEGADIFYISFADEVPITERYAALRKTFSEMGYEQVSMTSDVERAQEVNCYEWLQLISAEQKTGAEAQESLTDPKAEFDRCMAKVAADMGDKKDRRFTVQVEELRAKVSETLTAKYGDSFVNVDSSTSVSPSVGHDLLNNGLLAILYAIIGILIYISLRFDFRYAPGAVVALVHDVAITLGIFALFQVKFSLPIIAALLTIVGYSLNDTIVVMDRIRETFDAYKGRDISELLNRAVNSTLSRTIMTSVTTALVVAAILIYGGGLISDFALALMIGIVVGTYSSIFIATPFVYYMDSWMKRREAAQKASRGAKPSPA